MRNVPRSALAPFDLLMMTTTHTSRASEKGRKLGTPTDDDADDYSHLKVPSRPTLSSRTSTVPASVPTVNVLRSNATVSSPSFPSHSISASLHWLLNRLVQVDAMPHYINRRVGLQRDEFHRLTIPVGKEANASLRIMFTLECALLCWPFPPALMTRCLFSLFLSFFSATHQQKHFYSNKELSLLPRGSSLVISFDVAVSNH